MNKLETFEAHEKLIMKLVHDHVNKHGGEWAELFQEAYLAFEKAFESFDDDKAKFSTFLTIKVRFHLLDVYRSTCKHFVREKQLVPQENETIDFGADFNPAVLTDYLDELNADAAAVLQATMQEQLHNITAIRKFFRAKDWTMKRINESLNCLEGALCS